MISYLEMEQEYFGRILEVYTNTFSFKERFFQVVFEGLFFDGVDFNHAILRIAFLRIVFSLSVMCLMFGFMGIYPL